MRSGILYGRNRRKPATIDVIVDSMKAGAASVGFGVQGFVFVVGCLFSFLHCNLSSLFSLLFLALVYDVYFFVPFRLFRYESCFLFWPYFSIRYQYATACLRQFVIPHIYTHCEFTGIFTRFILHQEIVMFVTLTQWVSVSPDSPVHSNNNDRISFHNGISWTLIGFSAQLDQYS